MPRTKLSEVERAQRDMERHALLTSRLRKKVRELGRIEAEMKKIEKRRKL